MTSSWLKQYFRHKSVESMFRWCSATKLLGHAVVIIVSKYGVTSKHPLSHTKAQPKCCTALEPGNNNPMRIEGGVQYTFRVLRVYLIEISQMHPGHLKWHRLYQWFVFCITWLRKCDITAGPWIFDCSNHTYEQAWKSALMLHHLIAAISWKWLACVWSQP